MLFPWWPIQIIFLSGRIHGNRIGGSQCGGAGSTWYLGLACARPSHFVRSVRYTRHVRNRTAAACLPQRQVGIQKHSAQVPYALLVAGPSEVLRSIRSADLPWSIQVGVYGWSRMRAGLTDLRAIGGRHTRARFAQCIFCESTVRNGHVHTLACCEHWASFRAEFVALAPPGTDSLAGGLCKAILTVSPENPPSFAAAVSLCDSVDKAASSFWSWSNR